MSGEGGVVTRWASPTRTADVLLHVSWAPSAGKAQGNQALTRTQDTSWWDQPRPATCTLLRGSLLTSATRFF